MYLFIAGCVVASLLGCAAGRSFNTGQSLEDAGKYEEAMLSYADAFRAEPEVLEYRAKFLNARDKAASIRYAKGLEESNRGDYSAALTDFQVAHVLDPSKEIYKQRVDITTRKRDAQQVFNEGIGFEKDNKPKFAKLAYERAIVLNPDESAYKVARDRVRGLLDNKPSGYELNLSSQKSFAFKFTGSGLKAVFQILTQLSGINFIFDEGVKDQPVTIYLERTNFRQVLDLLSTMYKLGSTVLNEKTVLIYPKTADKIKQYENMKMHTFHLNYMDAKKAINLIRSMLPARKIYVNEESNSIVVRDTSATVDVIEKLLDANDIPDAEVLLDVEVIELNDKNTKNVGLLLSRYAVDIAGFNLDSGLLLADRLSKAQQTDTTTDAGIGNLVNVFTWNGYGGFVTVPSATYNFGKTVAKGEILSNPKIRVKNKEKAKFTVGTRVPITTTTTNGTVGGYSVNVQYVDVGVKLNAEPLIQLNNSVDIKLSLEVSAIVGQETLADGITTVVTIGTRNLETVLSLKDGETSVMGGLKSKVNTDNQNKIFLLGDIPLIGPFISGNNSSNDKTEIVLAITPHLVRGLISPPATVASFMSGKEDDPSLATFPPSLEEEMTDNGVVWQAPGQGTAHPVGIPPLPSSPAGPQPGIPQVPPVPQTVPAPVEMQPGAIPSGSGAPTPQMQNATVKKGQILIAAPATGTLGEPFTLDVRAENVESFTAAPFSLTFDPALVELVSVAEGASLRMPGMQTNFSSSLDPAGSVKISLQLSGGTSLDGGSGVLAKLVFRSKKQGSAAFGFRDVAFTSANGTPVPVVPVAATVLIQ
jgi:general secretion pathway protein D